MHAPRPNFYRPVVALLGLPMDVVCLQQAAQRLEAARAQRQRCAELETRVATLPAPLADAPGVRDVLRLIDEAREPLDHFVLALKAAGA